VRSAWLLHAAAMQGRINHEPHVRLSVCQMRGLWQNECSLLWENFTKTDPPPSKKRPFSI